MATALVTLIWCDWHLAEKDEEVPATEMPPFGDGLRLDLCKECAEPVLAVHALYERFGSKGDRTPKPPRNLRAALARQGKTSTQKDARAIAEGAPTTSRGLAALHPCPAPDCDSVLGSRQSLAAHARNTHHSSLPVLEGKPTPYACDQPDCGKAFASPQGLALHRKQVHKLARQKRSA